MSQMLECRSARIGLALMALLVGASAPASAQAQNGRLNGTVTDQATGAGLDGARVIVTGTPLIATTDASGKFAVRSIAPGTYEVRALRIGYKPQVHSVTIGPNETAVLDFALPVAPVQLDEIVTTATGEQRKLEVGHAVSSIDAAGIAAEQPITSVTDLISGRAAGVQVLKSSGTTGTGARIRIRGANSISLSNEPLYYIDGVRLESSSSSSTLDIGGFGAGDPRTNGPSRLNDLNPDDIESIEIVKGPAAATLYGIQASNGVVRITTKKGHAGRAKWNFFAENGAVHDGNRYPLNYFGLDSTAATGASWNNFCTLQAQIDGSCTQTGVLRYSPLENPATRPLKTGLRQQYGSSVSGGTDQMNYFLSGTYENEDGVFRLPKLEEDSIRRVMGSVPYNQIRPNALERVSVRANVGANVSRNSEISATVGYLSSKSRFVENDNSVLTITGSAETSTNPPDVMSGWYYTPAQLFAELASQGVSRFTGGITYSWRPETWLSTRATVGYDVTNRRDLQFFPTGQVAPQDQNNDGLLHDNRFQISQTSVDVAVTAQNRLSESIGSKTSVGGQFFRDLTEGTLSTGRGLAVGSSTITGARQTEATSSSIEARSLGLFIDEEISYKQRLFLDGALRFDGNSAFGRNFKTTTYPKASLSWLVSNEPFFHLSALNTLRFRAALGASGRRPGTTDAVRFFSPVSAKKAGQGVAGLTIGGLGNPNLKPERSRELELGFDTDLLSSRLSLEFTYFNKVTSDALILKPVLSSAGEVQSSFDNLGRVGNKGAEVAVNLRLIDGPSLTWDMQLSGSIVHNKILKLGVKPFSVPGSFYQRHVQGYPAGGFWGGSVTYNDANSDHIIDASEITVDTTLRYLGPPMPTREASLNSSISFFHNRVRLGTQFDYRGGQRVDNSIENYRCYVGNCRGLVDKKAPLREQALAQAAYTGYSSLIVFDEPGWFIKLRELSLTFYAPDRWARAIGASTASLTLSGRNLWTITDYSGVDPEVNAFGQDNFSSSDFESQPQVQYWIARVNVGF
jgi:TonB-linked SusC/RagA family outer membrane protein